MDINVTRGSRSPTRRNIELKAVDLDPSRSLEVCRLLGALDQGVIWQRDTYFAAQRGALKLREESPGSPHLIQYERADGPQERQSSYRLVSVSNADELREALAAALGVCGVVEKRRHLFLWKHVRIHLDDVHDLGRFIEFEAVAPAHSDLTREHGLVAELRSAFGIADDVLCARGYGRS